jgi:N-acetylneuraminic acid mutarotase
MINKSNSIIHKKLFRNQNTKFSLDKRTSRSTTHLTIKDTQRNLLNSLSKDNDEYIIREYSKIIPKDFNMYVETIESSLGNYKMDYEKKNEEKQLKNYNPNFYIHLKDKLLIKKIHKHNRNFFNHALTPKNDDSNLKITIREKQYPNPYKSLAVIKHNSFIFDEINKNFLNRQGDLFKQKILNIKKYNNKYKVKMPKIHISNFTRIPFEIPLVDLTEDKDKKGLQTFKNISKKQNEGTLQLYAYYRYPNRNFPEGREQFSIFFYNNNRIYICGGLTVKMGIMPIWYLNMDKLEWNKVPQKENTNNRFGHTSIIYQNKIYFYGGRAKIDKALYYCGLEIFSLNEGIYYKPMLSKLNSPTLRRNHIAILIDEQIFIHGGVSENNEILSDCHLLNLNPLKWLKVSINRRTPNPKLYGHTGCVVVPKQYLINHKFNIYAYPDLEVVNCRIKKKGLYVFGGKSKEEGGISNKLWILTIGQKLLEWNLAETKGIPPRPRYNHSMSFYERGNFLIIHGGRNDLMSDTIAFDDTFVLDLEFFEWFKVELYSQFDKFKVLSRCGHQSSIYGNKLIIFGGMNNNNYIGSSLFIVNLDFTYNNQQRSIQEIMMKELKGQDDVEAKQKLFKLKNELRRMQLGLVTKVNLPEIK